MDHVTPVVALLFAAVSATGTYVDDTTVFTDGDAAGDDRFLHSQGYLSEGHDIAPVARSWAEAADRCANDPNCGGFTHVAGEDFYHIKTMAAGGVVASDSWETFIKRDSELFLDQGPEIILADQERLASFPELHTKYFVPPLPTDGPPTRFERDGILTDDECRQLIQLTAEHANIDNVYEAAIPGLYGANVGRILTEQRYNITHMATALRVREVMRRQLIDFFGVTEPLYYEHSHLVKRVAEEQEDDLRNMYLSPIMHADSCKLHIPTRTCVPRSQYCCASRSHSAIVYLNNDFTGGDLVFFNLTDDGPEVAHTVTPQCGRVVGFTSGAENVHGVTLIRSGIRYIFTLWFTQDDTKREVMPVPDPPYTSPPEIECSGACPAGDPRLDLAWDASYRAEMLRSAASPVS